MSLDLDLIYSQFNFKMDKSNHHRIYEFEKFRLDAAHLMLYCGEEEVALPPKAVETLLALVERRGEILSKDELMETIWTDSIVEEGNLAQYLHLLRKTLGNQENGNPFIETLRRRGYRFNGKVTVGDSLTGAKSENANQNFVSLHAPANGGAINEQTTDKILAPIDLQLEEEEKAKFPHTILPDEKTAAIPKSKSKNLLFVGASVSGLLILASVTFAFIYFRSETGIKDAPIKTFAVLPFKPLVADDRNEALELGMADTLINKLSGEEIIVRPLNAVRRYNSLEQDSLTVGRELGVEAVLEGNIQTSGDRIRISARLLRVGDGKQLWTGQFDEKLTDIFAVQDSISQRAAEALKISLQGREKKHYTENIEAYQLYLKGRTKLTPPDTAQAISYFQQAIEIDPNYALAYAGLAAAYRTLVLAGDAPPFEMMPQAKAAALRAVEIDDQLAEAHVALGTIAFFYEWDWQAAENHLLRALDLDPNSPDARFFYAHVLSNSGRHEQALAEERRALELDPLNLHFNALKGQFLFFAGKYDEAIVQLKKTMNLEPNFWLPHLFIARVYIEKEMFREAVDEATKARELSGGNTEAISFIGYALAKSGEKEKARAVLAELKKSAARRYIPPHNIALIHNSLDEPKEAFELLKKGFEAKDVRMAFLKVEPKWNNLRNEPRFIDLMRRMNFE